MNAFISSLYVGYALYAIFPYTTTVLGWGNTPEIKFALMLGVYVVAVALSFAVLRRFMSSSFSRSFVPMAVLGLFALGLLMALLYHVFGITAIFNLPSFLDSAFAPKAVFFYWFIAPLIGLFFLAR
jgi:hypothetical protein